MLDVIESSWSLLTVCDTRSFFSFGVLRDDVPLGFVSEAATAGEGDRLAFMSNEDNPAVNYYRNKVAQLS